MLLTNTENSEGPPLFPMSLDQLDRLQSFSGKRNAVVTLFVPPAAVIGKVLDGIEGRVKAIKHGNKRGQIVRVLEHIRERTGDRKTFGGNGCVVCCGLDNLDKLFYEEVNPPHKAIEEEEYFYDYAFHILKIRELFYADVVCKVTNEEEVLADTQRLAMSSSPLLLIGKVEIFKCLDELPGCIRTIVLFDNDSDKQSHLEFLTREFIDRLRSTKCTILRVPATKDDTQDFVKKFGSVFAHKRY